MIENETLPDLPEGYYWRVRDVDDILFSGRYLDLRRKRRWFWDADCLIRRIGSNLSNTDLTLSQIVELAHKMKSEHFKGPLAPLTGYTYKGEDF